MTNINCIPVKELSNRALRAEHEQLPRIYKLVKARLIKGNDPVDDRNFPDFFKYGTGHMLFFFDKLEYIMKREVDVHQELLRRKKRPKFQLKNPFDGYEIPKHLMNDWYPDEEAVALCRAFLKVQDANLIEKRSLMRAKKEKIRKADPFKP